MVEDDDKTPAPRDDDVEEVEELEFSEADEDVDGIIDDALAAVEAVEGGREEGEEASAEEVERLRQEVAELKDRSARTLAEFENFRKRSEREHRELKRYALTEPLRGLLDIVDNLERALTASGSLEDLKVGVEMILHQMQEMLRQHGVEPVPAEGESFNPNLHEAVMREEDTAVENPTVLEELQRGYRIHDRLLRPARVKVAVPAEEES